MPPKKPAAGKTVAKASRKAAAKAPVKGSTKSGPTAAKKGAPTAKTSAGATKKGAAPVKGKTKEQPKPEVKKWTKEDEAATKIQTMVRGKQARSLLQKKKDKKKAYEEEMDRLEKEAFVYLVKLEQEQAEREYQKELEERRRRNEQIKRCKRFFEAAFDGDNDEMMCVLQEVTRRDDELGVDKDNFSLRERNHLAVLEHTDAHGNTPLSEASSGGNVDVIKMLIERGANPNSRGQFERTPLYRAAYAGHLEACQVLLQYGADPRLYADDGQHPEHIASQDPVKELLNTWDIEDTKRLLTKLEAAQERRYAANKKRLQAEAEKLEDNMADIEKDYKNMQKVVQKLTEEMNKRIKEHDMCMAEGFDRTDITIGSINEAEMELEIAKMNLEKCRERLAHVKLEVREAKMKNSDDQQGEPGLPVMIREMDDVLLKDVGNKIKDAGKWPLIIDPSAQAATFLRYRDTNYLNALSPPQMEANKVRLALLGALRFGKPLVIDMMMIDMWDTITDRFNEILPGLMGMIMDWSIKMEENYIKLLKDDDGPEYNKNKFITTRTENFKLFIITKNTYPSTELLDMTYPIRVLITTN